METVAQIPKYNLNEEQEKKADPAGIPFLVAGLKDQIKARR